MSRGKIALAVLLVATGGFVAWAAAGGLGGGAPASPPGPGPVAPPPPAGGGGAPPAEAPGATDLSSPARCIACHADVGAEWTASMHAKSWTDPEVRALSDDFRSTECISCHAPQPIHSAPVGGRVFERSSRFETGVDCLSCHLLPDGGVAASRDLPSAPCRPRRVETLRDAATCKGCHNQHSLVDEWETLFRAPDPGKGAVLRTGRPETCIDCHMAPVDRRRADGTVRKGVDHVIPGGHHEAMLRKGVTLAARIEGGALVAEATNSGAGHRAPADSRHRSFNVWATVRTAEGIVVQDRTELAEFRMYYRSPPKENTNLRPGETQVSRLDLPRGMKGKVLVELVYAMNPLKKERHEAVRVHAVELDFDTTAPK